MAYDDIRKDFVDGVQEIFTELFNDGITCGIDLFRLSEKTVTNVYGESRVKLYQKPIKLVAKVELSPTQGEQDTESVKNSVVFTVPLKDLQMKGIDVSHEGLSVLRQCKVEHNGVVYLVDNVLPKTYVVGVCLMYDLVCTEEVGGEIALEPEETEGGDVDEPVTPNEGGLEQGGIAP